MFHVKHYDFYRYLFTIPFSLYLVFSFGVSFGPSFGLPLAFLLVFLLAFLLVFLLAFLFPFYVFCFAPRKCFT